MRVLLAVIKDLYLFTAYVLFGWYRARRARDRAARLPAPYVGGLALDAAETALLPIEKEPRSVEEVLRTHTTLAPILPRKNSIVYCTQAHTPLLTLPNGEPGTATVGYGDMLMVLEADGEWAHVASGERKGYVRTSVLVERAADVYPEFVIAEENGPRAESTMRLRACINDEFSAGLSQVPLGAHEYAYYKLLRRGVRIEWPDIRPRTPGTWARILSRVPNVTVRDEPSAGAVMEFTLEGTKAHLAYVEKIFPDGAIHLSEADWPDQGTYNERVLVRDEWRALNPVFINCL